MQWSLAYLAAAFALLQGIDIVAQHFGWPAETMRIVIIILIVGLFITLVVAWYHGERGAQRVTGTELLILALLLAIGGGLLWRFAVASGENRANSIGKPNDANVLGAPAVTSSKSIAVLPFDNLSDDKANAYFAEGVQDEILTRLAKVADLKVISRTSTQRFKSAPSDLREIAKQLGVMHIVEGSVQKANDQVRVNVQLINALTDAHLWADTFDRRLNDIFAVESEIAKTIADTLQAKLSGPEKTAMSQKPTANGEAYELYLQGRFFWNKRTAADLRKSIDFFNEAIAKDPHYAPAYAGEAQAWSLLSAYNAASPAESYPQAEAFAKKALAIDDTSAEALVGLASVNANYEFDIPAALKNYQRAIQLNPNDATAHHWLGGDCFGSTGQHAAEVAELQRALELDPLSLIINSNLGVAYMRAGRVEEAVAQFRKTIEMDGSFYPAHRDYGLAFELQGKIPEAIAQYEKAAALTDDPIPHGALGRIYGIAGRRDEAQKIFEQLRQLRGQRYTAAYSLALVALGLGDKSEALHWLEEAYRERDGDSIGVIRFDPLLAALHGDPRFEALAEKIVPERLLKSQASPK
ncbi:MAG: tetratricopeptide repeat protein [Chthoniobacterales bacterium]